MRSIEHIIRRVRRVTGDVGSSLVEYALLVAFVACACIATVQVLSAQVSQKLDQITALYDAPTSTTATTVASSPPTTVPPTSTTTTTVASSPPTTVACWWWRGC